MAFKPSLRAVLPPETLEPARAVLGSGHEAGAHTPWFVRVLAGGGAWVSSLFMLDFLDLFTDDSKGAISIVVGLLITAGAVGLRRASSGTFVTQLGLSLGLAGQAIFLWGVSGLTETRAPLYLAAMGLQAVLFVVYPDIIQRFLSALFASLALMFLLREGAPGVLMDVTLVGFTATAHVLLLKQGRSRSELVTPAAFGLITTIFWVLLMRAWFHDVYLDLFRDKGLRWPEGVLTMGLAAVTLYSAWRVMEETGAQPGGPAGRLVFAALALTALLTLRTPGVIAALGVLMLGFHRRGVVLIGLAVLFVLVFGVSHYYDLGLSLLAKSLALLGSGLLMLGVRVFVSRRFPVTPEAS